MYFKAIKGHGENIALFKKWVVENSFEGVYLFTGPKGVGKFTTARQLCKYILCTGVKDDTCRCGSCKIFPGTPDYLEISKGGGETIKVADAESIDNFTSLLPYKSRKRVVLIDDAENLNVKAANRLLKVLEDIKSHMIVILVSSNPHLILPTIKSRTTEIPFSRLSVEESLEVLKDRGMSVGKIKDMSKAIPYLRESMPRAGLKYYEYYKYVPSFLELMVSSSEDEVLSAIKSIEENENISYFAEMLVEYLSDMLRIMYDAENNIHFDAKFKEIEKLTFSWNDDLCIAFANRLRNAISDYDRGINLKLYNRVRTAVSWVYILLQNHLGRKQSKAKVAP